MSDTTEHLTEHTHRVDTYWWIDQVPNRDAYQLSLVRYTYMDDDLTKCEFLSPEGQWIEYPEGGFIQHTLYISGRLIQAMSTYEILDRRDMASQLRRIAMDIMEKVLQDHPEAKDGNL